MFVFLPFSDENPTVRKPVITWAQVITGFLTVGFSSENGKKTNIYLIETSDSINWSVDTSHVYFFADLTTFTLSTFKALSTALPKSFLSNEPFSPSITISFGQKILLLKERMAH